MLRIVHLTDPHLPAHPEQSVFERDADRSLQSILAATRRLQPDLLIMTGDLSDTGDVRAYRRLRELIRIAPCPVLALPGNHDDPEPMRRELGSAYWGVGRIIETRGWRIIGLSSHWPGHPGGRLGMRQLKWLAHRLRETHETPTLIALHHPPIPTASRWLDAMNLQDAPLFRALLKGHPQVKVVLFGHGHQPFDSRHGPCRFLGTPSTLRQFLPRQDRPIWTDQPGGWRRLWLSASGQIHTTLSTLDPTRVHGNFILS